MAVKPEDRWPWYEGADKQFVGAALVFSVVYPEGQPWGSGRLYKAKRCCYCGRRMEKMEIAWRPVAWPANRHHRMCFTCLDQLVRARDEAEMAEYHARLRSMEEP